MELKEYVDEAKDFLKSHEPPEGYHLGFSGGKDSIVTLSIAREAGVKHHAAYCQTGIDPPELVRFVRREYPEVSVLRPAASFFELIQKKGLPMVARRWCCSELKKKPSRSIPLSYRVVGIRAEESWMRARRPRVDQISRKETLLKPIFHWPEWAVWELIESRRLAYPSLYDEGFSRIGCVCCFFIFGVSENAKRRLALYQSRWPGIWKAFRHAVDRRFFSWFGDVIPAGKEKIYADKFWELYLTGGHGKERLADFTNELKPRQDKRAPAAPA